VQTKVAFENATFNYGTTYETIFRIFKELIEQDIIMISGKDIKIKNFEKLFEFSKETSL